MSKVFSRRKFFRDTALSTTGIMLGSTLMGLSPEGKSGSSSYNLMKEVMKYPKIDAHIHVNLSVTDQKIQDAYAEELIVYAERLGIKKMVISKPLTSLKTKGTPEEFIQYNNILIRAMKRFPDRFIGQFTLNPVYQKESLEEIKRCVDQGMTGLKVYYQVKLNDPLFFPIIEKMTDLRMITLMHACTIAGRGGFRPKYGNLLPNESTPEDFVDVAKRYPEAMLQFAHIGGGGDWEYECKTLKDYPNIYVDTSGSNNEEAMIDFALKYLGEDRLLFGSDNCYYQGVGKILASGLNESQKKKIFFENYNNILRKAGRDVS